MRDATGILSSRSLEISARNESELILIAGMPYGSSSGLGREMSVSSAERG